MKAAIFYSEKPFENWKEGLDSMMETLHRELELAKRYVLGVPAVKEAAQRLFELYWRELVVS